MTETVSFYPQTSGRLDQLLTEHTGKTRSYIQRQIQLGQVEVNGLQTLTRNQKLKKGDKVRATLIPDPLPELLPEEGTLNILYEDDFLLAIDKPQGLVVHPAPGNFSGTLANFLMHYLGPSHQKKLDNQRLGIVHRLDKGTSGVLVIAKTSEARESLLLQFKNRSIQKTYECLVWGTPPLEGKINSALGRHRVHRKKMSSRSSKTKDALTLFKVLHSSQGISHVEVYPKTGRTHQIRVHLSELKHPIVGDTLYGGTIPENISLKAQIHFPFLHAKKIMFSHPQTQEIIKVEAPRPEIFNTFLELLKKESPIVH